MMYRIYDWRPWAVVPEQSRGNTEGLRVIHSVAPCVLKDYRLGIVPFSCLEQLAAIMTVSAKTLHDSVQILAYFSEFEIS